MLFDTHAHLDQADFDEIRPQVIARAQAAGVERIVAVGTTLAASEKCVRLADEYPGVFAAVGIHPNHAAEATLGDWSAIERMARSLRVVAIGETGLDRHWDFTPFELQQDYFDRHMRLASAVDGPFIVHMRDCEAEVMAMLRDAYRRGPLKGIMHSFTGDEAMAAECVAMGMHISFAGMLTFKKSQHLRDCAATIPDDRLMIETDCPYLSPEPVRSQRPNEPANLRYTAQRLAEVRGISVESLAALTTGNARELFAV
jgi:TatD DNase family protein